ncbi:MAG: MDR family MFS transporter [Armatimonadota bacterium]|nr:MDR family MFS transporter [Armatimonadota bacterium]
MSRSRALVTLGVMLSMFLAAMEGTVVATAMPTIVGQLGGLSIYAWVFSGYLLASTTTVPIFGKLSDQLGRRPVYAVAMGLFLAGSLLCGQAQSMGQLIAFRVLQGLGAGGILPLAFTIVGALYNYEQRARMQGLFSGVWGLSSIVGPLLGGFLVDQVSWPWIFYINVFPGLLAAALIWFFWVDEARAAGPARVDYLGAGLLSSSVVALLLGLFALRTSGGAMLIALAAVLATALWAVERRAAEPVLPIPLFRDRLFAAASAHGLLAGFAMFGSIAFVPLFVQAVLGTTATAAGATLTPFMLGWVVASVTGSRLLLRIGYRTLAVSGMASLTVGALLMSRVGPHASQATLMVDLTLMGIGMGLSVPSLTIAVQTAVARRHLGTATSTLQFARSIGGAIGVNVMGAVLALRLAGALAARGLDPAGLSLHRLLDPLGRSSAGAAMDAALRGALGDAIGGVFVIAFVAATAGLAATATAPAGSVAQLAQRSGASGQLAGR